MGLTHVTLSRRCLLHPRSACSLCRLCCRLWQAPLLTEARGSSGSEKVAEREGKRERERERKPRITKTTEEADLTNPRAYKERGMQKSSRDFARHRFSTNGAGWASGARRTFETREQRARYNHTVVSVGVSWGRTYR